MLNGVVCCRDGRIWHPTRIVSIWARQARAHAQSKALNLVIFLPIQTRAFTRWVDRIRHRAGTRASISLHDTLWSTSALICLCPGVPKYPAHGRTNTTTTDHRNRTHSTLDDTDETADEDNDGTNMLHDDCRISHQRPEIIRANTWVPLEMIEKGFCVGVIIRVCCSLSVRPAIPIA